MLDYSSEKYVELGSFLDADCISRMLKELDNHINSLTDLACRPLEDCENDK